MRSVTGLHIYYYFGHLCDYQLRKTVCDARPPITAPGLLLLLEQGRRNEDIYVEHLRHLTEVASLKEGTMEERAVQTLEAMRRGVPILHNGVLDGGRSSSELASRYAERGLAVRFRGETDLLIRVDDAPSALGDWSYRVADVKSSRMAKFPQLMQVAYYDWLLEAVQERSVGKGSIVAFPSGSAGEPNEELFDVAPLMPSLRLLLEEKLGDVLAAPPETLGWHLRHGCRRCLWHGHCEERASSTDDLCLVPGLRPAQRQTLIQQSIGTTRALAEANDERLSNAGRQVRAGSEGLQRMRLQARAVVAGRSIMRAALPDVLVDWLAENDRAPIDLFSGKSQEALIDIQTDALADTAFGYAVQIGDHPEQWFAADDPRQEDLAFFRFAEGIERLHARAGDHFAVLHFGAWEPYRLARLCEKYPRSEATAAVKEALRRMIDVHEILRRAFYLPRDIATPARAMRLFVGAPDVSGTLVRDLTDQIRARANDEAEVGGAVEELTRAAGRIGVDPESLLGEDDDLPLVWFRMHLESRHALWMQLIELRQRERVSGLHKLVRWLQNGAPLPPEDEAYAAL